MGSFKRDTYLYLVHINVEVCFPGVDGRYGRKSMNIILFQLL